MEQVIAITDGELLRTLFGPSDRNAKKLHKRFGVDLLAREGGLKLVGDEVSVREAAGAIQRAIHVFQRDRVLSDETMRRILEGGDSEPQSSRVSVLPEGVEGRSPGQDHYIAAMRDNSITISIGPAGTGKTYLAAAVAVSMLRQGQVKKLLLCRPAVEAGEHLGFLPGDFEQKVNPYLRPLYDALFGLLDVRQVRDYMDRDIIEIAPLAYMRGRTLERAFIILDEAQNTTPTQMKMFLTRLGQRSRMVVTGDVTQIDLPEDQKSGLIEAAQLLGDIHGISIVHLHKSDIVRHPLVQKIVDVYERKDSESARSRPL